jgi:Flp pilus assembly protein TadG
MRRFRDAGGSVSVYIAVLAVPFLLLTGLVVDGGGALVAKQRAGDEAEQAARAGANAIDLAELRATGLRKIDCVQAQHNVDEYLAGTSDNGKQRHPPPVCTPAEVTVTVTVIYEPTILALISTRPYEMTQTATSVPISQ